MQTTDAVPHLAGKQVIITECYIDFVQSAPFSGFWYFADLENGFGAFQCIDSSLTSLCLVVLVFATRFVSQAWKSMEGDALSDCCCYSSLCPLPSLLQRWACTATTLRVMYNNIQWAVISVSGRDIMELPDQFRQTKDTVWNSVTEATCGGSLWDNMVVGWPWDGKEWPGVQWRRDRGQ